MKSIILDFDGTICQSYELIYQNLCQYSKLTPMIPAEELRSLSSSDVVKKLNLTTFDQARLIYTIRKDFKNKISGIPPVKGVLSVLKSLAARGYELYLSTSNSKPNVAKFFDLNGGLPLKDLKSQSTIFGKASGIQDLIKKHEIDKSQAVYVGDETRDIEAAKKSGIKSCAVSWGYNTKETLMKNKPDYFASEPEDLLTLFA